MKKDGFTFIEVLGALAILSILIIVNFKGFKYYKEHIRKVETTSDLYEIRDILSFSKLYCFENEIYGEIYFDNSEELSKVYLLSQGHVIKTVLMSKDIKLINSNCVVNNKKFLKIDVNESGYVSPYTLIFKDEYGNEEKIIIQVGGNLIYIKYE